MFNRYPTKVWQGEHPNEKENWEPVSCHLHVHGSVVYAYSLGSEECWNIKTRHVPMSYYNPRTVFMLHCRLQKQYLIEGMWTLMKQMPRIWTTEDKRRNIWTLNLKNETGIKESTTLIYLFFASITSLLQSPFPPASFVD